MKLRLKEDPREWRKSVLLTALGMALLSSVLWERHVLSPSTWLVTLGLLALVSAVSFLQPRWFRGYYRLSMRAGVALSHVVARVVLVVIFLLVVTPLGFLLRISGKDLLGLKRAPRQDSYWSDSPPPGSLDRMF